MSARQFVCVSCRWALRFKYAGYTATVPLAEIPLTPGRVPAPGDFCGESVRS